MRQATDVEVEFVNELTGAIDAHNFRNTLRREYFDGEKRLDYIGFSIPPKLRSLDAVIGWPKKACAVRAQRLKPRGFTGLGRGIQDVVDAVSPSVELERAERGAISTALRYGFSMVFTTAGDPARGEPLVLHTVRSPLVASVILSPRSGLPVVALEHVDFEHVNLYLPGRVLSLVKINGAWNVENDAFVPGGVVPVAVYVNEEDPDKPLGASAITRPLMYFTDHAVRTVLRMETSAEFYSAPGEYLLGANPEDFQDSDGNIVPGWEMVIGAVRVMPDEEDELTGERHRAEIQHRPQMTMQPHNDQLRTIAAQVSGETSIPLQYLGVVQDSNPTSAAAIEASEVDLINVSTASQTSLNRGRLMLLRNTFALSGELTDVGLAEIAASRPQWVDPRTRSLIETGQFVAQQVQAGNFQPGTEATLEQLRMSPEDIAQHVSDNRAARGQATALSLTGGGEDPEVEQSKVMKSKLDALGVGRRAGATFKSLVREIGLEGIEDSGAVPVNLRLPVADTTGLEEA